MKSLNALYPNIHTKKNAMSQIKHALLELEEYHPDYGARMAEKENELVRAFREVEGDKEAEALVWPRVKSFYDFRGCSLRRKLQLQKKVRLGDTTLFPCEEDNAFVASLPLMPSYIDELKLTSSEIREHKTSLERSLQRQSEQVIRIEHGMKLVVEARRVLRDPSASPEALATAIALVSGRRMVEIYSCGTFVETLNHRYGVLFQGQAKTGLQAIKSVREDSPMAYPIPTLARGKFVVAALAKLRALTGCIALTPSQVNSKYCKRLNDYVKKNIHPHITFHDLRTLYALISYEMFKPHTYSINGWVSKFLGHAGLAMSVHYTRMQVYGLDPVSRTKWEASEDFEPVNDREVPFFIE